MELGVPGDGPGVAAGEESTSARFLTTSGEVAGGVCGAGVDGNSDPLGSDSVEGNATARVGVEGGIDQSWTPSEEARRLSDQGRRHSAPASVPAADRCLAFEQVVPLLRYLDRKAAKYADSRHSEAQREFVKQRAQIEAELHSERIQNSTLAEELVQQTRLLEQCQIAHKADEELLRRL
ncbi:hypothetical protein AXG93_2508s1000 [Marchantia polymorpha subsp. ruderalis]|uniref:Uncharacterized protein n=1 Tax=Marchantia polymorpha subsp. ruderalis TaxID=1480154 RepID=A0A176WDD8_MARPO|nr:hypothetical protein AXG93_2508s1000 [Marchantia polymorpha subsp. ruderalis]